MSWYLAPSLNTLRNQINSRWPARSKASDGTIGDWRHRLRKSDHNPDSKGCVHAIDITASGIDPQVVIQATIKDYRTAYVIFQRRIWSNGVWRTYRGVNPHNTHIHISIKHSAYAETTTHSWQGITPVAPTPAAPSADEIDRLAKAVIAGQYGNGDDRKKALGSKWGAVQARVNQILKGDQKTSATAAKPAPKATANRTMHKGSSGADVRALQKGLAKVFPAYRHTCGNLVADGIFGGITDCWVREFQRRTGLKVDGWVGPNTKRMLANYGIRV